MLGVVRGIEQKIQKNKKELMDTGNHVRGWVEVEEIIEGINGDEKN